MTHNTVAITYEGVKMLLVFSLIIIASYHIGLFIDKIKEISCGFYISARERPWSKLISITNKSEN